MWKTSGVYERSPVRAGGFQDFLCSSRFLEKFMCFLGGDVFGGLGRRNSINARQFQSEPEEVSIFWGFEKCDAFLLMAIHSMTSEKKHPPVWQVVGSISMISISWEFFIETWAPQPGAIGKLASGFSLRRWMECDQIDDLTQWIKHYTKSIPNHHFGMLFVGNY